MSTALSSQKKHQFSAKELKTLPGRLQSMKNRVEKIKAHTEKVTEKIIRTAEVGGTAFAVGVLNGKTGGIEVAGVPLELGAGIALNVLSYMGAAGKMSDHLGNVGDGALSAFATMEGVKIGLQWAQKSEGGGTKQVGGSKPAAIPAAPTGVSLTPEEVEHAAAMAAVPR